MCSMSFNRFQWDFPLIGFIIPVEAATFNHWKQSRLSDWIFETPLVFFQPSAAFGSENWWGRRYDGEGSRSDFEVIIDVTRLFGPSTAGGMFEAWIWGWNLTEATISMDLFMLESPWFDRKVCMSFFPSNSIESLFPLIINLPSGKFNLKLPKKKAIEILTFPIKHADFLWLWDSLPEGMDVVQTPWVSNAFLREIPQPSAWTLET